jgi:hypothetical protein
MISRQIGGYEIWIWAFWNVLLNSIIKMRKSSNLDHTDDEDKRYRANLLISTQWYTFVSKFKIFFFETVIFYKDLIADIYSNSWVLRSENHSNSMRWMRRLNIQKLYNRLKNIVNKKDCYENWLSLNFNFADFLFRRYKR